MAKTLQRMAAFRALWRALTIGSRGGPSLGRRLGALPRMIRATWRGQYDGGGRLAMMVFAAFYIVSPFDVIPEFILVFGLIDDVAVVGWLAGAVLSETERFLRWEARRRVVLPG
jgi:uncharacterized membrane protein YkvA (DUF1232 family)